MSQLASSFLARLQGIVHGGGGAARGFLHSDMYVNGFAAIPFTQQDRRELDKTYKLMDAVLKACQSSRLNLKNSPPFILDILPDTFTQLISIFTREPTILANNAYVELFVRNVRLKCKEVLKLFKTTAIYDESSAERRKLTKLSLVFSHMLSELRAFFKDGEYVADKFRLTKKEADVFWKQTFKSKTFVPWSEFVVELTKEHKLNSEAERTALKATVDLTCNDYISHFEFDVFTRLFYPWKSLIKNWNLLTSQHPGYVAFLTYDEVKKRLEKFIKKPGSYVFRLSCTRLGQWAIGYVAPDGKIYQTIPQNKSLIQALHEGSREGFYLYPNGQDDEIDLAKQFEIPTADRVKVSSEQHEIYCEMGTTFELCKICDDAEKNVRLEPCGHLLCSTCLTQWNDSESGNTCPFCRYEIKGTSRVVIDKFKAEEEAPPKQHAPPMPSAREAREESPALITFDDVPSTAEPSPPALAPPVPPRITPRDSTRRSSSTASSSSSAFVDLATAPTVDAPAAPLLLAPPPPPSPLHPPVPLPRLTSSTAEDLYVNVAEDSTAAYVNAAAIRTTRSS